MSHSKKIFLLLATLVFIWSGISPTDRFTWLMEVFPSIIGLPLLVFINRKYKVNKFLFVLLCVHSMILSLGGKYTYAEVPLGFWVQDLLALSRNHYDRLGHFFQGVSPSLIAYYFFKSKNVVTSQKWLKVFCISLALSFSVFYEFLEWWTALATGEAAEAFLGTQGDPWDTQWDMFFAFLGASASMISVSFLKWE
ncbi:MAG: DUF2238 domain-containing protein [Bdellovibrionales bacterium]|nr:DUF2238 domain-containing protein [Bdellovibrionales bacterium]